MMNKFIKRLIRWVENWLDYQAQRVVTMKKWADWNHMKVKKSKGKVLCGGQKPDYAVTHSGESLSRKQIHSKGWLLLGDT